LVGEDVLDALELGHLELSSSAALWPDPTRKGIYAIQPAAGGEMLHQLGELDVVFPILHGTFGEDGSLQGLLELADLAYVGAGVLGSALGMDKAVFKSVMRAHGIPVVDWIVATRAEIQHNIGAVIDRALSLGDFPLFIKPANLGSSVGVTRCITSSDVLEGLNEAARFDRRVLIERGLKNPHEIEVSVLATIRR